MPLTSILASKPCLCFNREIQQMQKPPLDDLDNLTVPMLISVQAMKEPLCVLQRVKSEASYVLHRVCVSAAIEC